MKVPEPWCYNGTRDAKNLGNFLFDIEQYFLITRIDSKDLKVTTVVSYLTGDAKLWWHTRVQNGSTFELWVDLKKELKIQSMTKMLAT